MDILFGDTVKGEVYKYSAYHLFCTISSTFLAYNLQQYL